MGHVEFTDEPLQRVGFLERIQILALDIFDQGDRDCGTIIHLPHHYRNVLQAGQLGGTPAALAGDDFVVSAADGAHHDRLDHTLRTNGIGQVFQALVVHVDARLVFAALQQFHPEGTQFSVHVLARCRHRRSACWRSCF